MAAAFDTDTIRKDFPILAREVNGKPLIYFDNGATTQKPQRVIDALVKYYSFQNSNIHRGVHTLSQEATSAYEEARETVRDFIGAKHAHEIIFTRGATEAINLVAHSFGKAFVNQGDEIIITAMEHHSNIVPWQILCEERGAVLKHIPVNALGELAEGALETLLSPKTKLVAVAHVSNALGTVNSVADIVKKAHAAGAKVLIDGCQAIQHLPVNVTELDADFYCFSGHKIYAPTGVGILYGKEALLNAMPPYQGGGDMIKTVTLEKTTYNELPHKFEAGTPHIEGGLGLAEALRYVKEIGIENIAAYEHELLQYATQKLQSVQGLRIIGTAAQKASLISFVVNGVHPYDIGVLLDKMGIAVRTGHHCAQPVMDIFEIPGTVRASFAFYNTKAEIDVFCSSLERALNMLR